MICPHGLHDFITSCEAFFSASNQRSWSTKSSRLTFSRILRGSPSVVNGCQSIAVRLSNFQCVAI